MKRKQLLLAAALITLPTGTCFAQAVADPASGMQDRSSASSTASGATAQPGADDATQAAAAPQAAAPATRADLKVNAPVYDPAGGKVGTIESVTPAGAVVSTGVARAQIPVASFTKTGQGLALNMTKTQLEAAVANAATSKQ